MQDLKKVFLQNKPNLIVMVGLPASGKSTFAEQISKEFNCVLLSSDNIRKEIFGNEKDQSNNELVFSTLYKIAKENLNLNKSVVIDATNVSMKDRRRVLSNFQSKNINKIAVFVATPIKDCIKWNNNRERVVSENIFNLYLSRFELPMTYEGFDSVVIKHLKQISDQEKEEFFNKIQLDMDNFDQKNPHHIYTLGEHTRKVTEYLKNCPNVNQDLLTASKYHDIGKLYTQTIDDKGIAHYYQHANVGAYILASLGFNQEIVFYVNYHMLPFYCINNQTKEKYKNLFGEERINNLLLFNECDKKASKDE